jgi:hypothetical protein
MMQPMATSEAVPMPNSSAPSMAAMTMSRPVRMPPSARRTTEWRRLFRVSTWLASDRPISHGPPAYFTEVWDEAPVPPTPPATRITSALALATPGRDRADAGGGHQLHRDAGDRVDLLQVIDELGQVLDRIDVVVRRRADQHHAGGRMAQTCDHLGDLEAGQLPALAGLGALGDLDLQLDALVQIFGGDAEPARGHLLDGAVGVVAVRQGLVARAVLAALARDRLGPDAVHGDVQHAVGFRAQGAQAHARA